MPPKHPKPLKHRPTTEEKICPWCGVSRNARGYTGHEKACRREYEELMGPTPAIVGGAEGKDGNILFTTCC